jgi:hypothetical protein
MWTPVTAHSDSPRCFLLVLSLPSNLLCILGAVSVIGSSNLDGMEIGKSSGGWRDQEARAAVRLTRWHSFQPLSPYRNSLG